MISRNLALRLLIAAIFIPLLLYISHRGGIFFLLFVEIVILLSLWEFFALTGVKTYLWQKLLLMLLALYPALSLSYFDGRYILEAVAASLFLSTLPYVFSKQLGNIGRSMGLTFLGTGYLAAGFTSLILIRNGAAITSDQASDWVIFLFATIWIVDTAAYYFGWQFGKAKLSPSISPNKTVIGFLGGFIGAVLTAFIFNFIFLSEIGFALLIPPAIVIAFFGQLGDLVESIFKREAGVKDSSNLIPGHGGILDRFDSLVFAAPSLYFYLKLIS